MIIKYIIATATSTSANETRAAATPAASINIVPRINPIIANIIIVKVIIVFSSRYAEPALSNYYEAALDTMCRFRHFLLLSILLL